MPGRAAEVSIPVLGRLTRAKLAGTGLPVEAWYSGLVTANDSANVTWMAATKSTPYFDPMGGKKDVTKLRQFGCEAVMYLEVDLNPIAWASGVGFCPVPSPEYASDQMATDRNTSAQYRARVLGS